MQAQTIGRSGQERGAAARAGARAKVLGVCSMNTQCLDLDLHRLDLRFAGARVVEPRAVERIDRSIERGGQLVPCIAVVDPPIEVLKGDVLGVMARTQSRSFAAIEEALLVRELV
jgi:hypothetical protein